MDLVGPAGVVAERIEGQRDVARTGVAHRLAIVERLERGEFVDLRFDRVGEPQHDPAALAGIHPRPRPLVEGLPRGVHGCVDISGIALRDLSDHFLGGRVDRVERLPTLGGHPLAADEELRLVNRGAGGFHRGGGSGHGGVLRDDERMTKNLKKHRLIAAAMLPAVR